MAGRQSLLSINAKQVAATKEFAVWPDGNEYDDGASTISWKSSTTNGLVLPTIGFITRSTTIIVTAMAIRTVRPSFLCSFISRRGIERIIQINAWADMVERPIIRGSRLGDAPWSQYRMFASLIEGHRADSI